VGDIDADSEQELIIGSPVLYNADTDASPGGVLIFDIPIEDDKGYDGASVIFRGTPDEESLDGVEGLGVSVVVRDFDADGHDDLLTGADIVQPNGLFAAGRAYLLYGPQTAGGDIRDEADWILDGQWEWGLLGSKGFAVGDLDDDGAEDFALGTQFGDYKDLENSGYLLFYTSKSEGIQPADEDVFAVIHGSKEFIQFGEMAVSVDADGDGEDDVLMTATRADSTNGALYLFQHGFSGMLTEQDAEMTWVGEDNAYAGVDADHVGDLNGDGYADVGCVGPYYDDGRGYILFGGPELESEPLSDADVKIRNSVSGRRFGASIDGLDDMNGDGYDDVILGDESVGGNLYLFYGLLESGVYDEEEADVILLGNGTDSTYEPVFNAGDLTGDSVDDLIVGSSSAANEDDASNAGMVYLIPGNLW